MPAPSKETVVSLVNAAWPVNDAWNGTCRSVAWTAVLPSPFVATASTIIATVRRVTVPRGRRSCRRVKGGSDRVGDGVAEHVAVGHRGAEVDAEPDSGVHRLRVQRRRGSELAVWCGGQ